VQVPGSIRKSIRKKNFLQQSPGLPSAGGSGKKPSHAVNADYSW